MLFDTHCHLDLTEKYYSIYEILKNCKKNQVLNLVTIGTDLTSSQWNLNFIKEFNKKTEEINIYCTAGLHPESIQDTEQIEEILKFIRYIYKEAYFVGIGETGLDLYYNLDTKELQLESFYKHLFLAKELNLPVIVHCRDDKQYNESKVEAVYLILDLIKEINYPKGIMHCFTYSYKEARQFLDYNWFISFSGIVTFKNASYIQECAKKIPLSNLLIETDSPFLAPVPYRGNTNQPANLLYVFEFLSEHLKVDRIILAHQLLENSKRIFNIKNL